MIINKDTLIFCSFAREAGNTGCTFFNDAFERRGINAIYKSFSIYNIHDAIQAAITLKFKGFAITMPFKIEALNYIADMDETVECIGATNTVINTNGILKAYNTDYKAARVMLQRYYNMPLVILGDGGYAAAVRYAAVTNNTLYSVITRKNWSEIADIRDSVIYNCTPVADINIHESNAFIDCLITSETGKELAKMQAEYQLELYLQAIENK